MPYNMKCCKNAKWDHRIRITKCLSIQNKKNRNNIHLIEKGKRSSWRPWLAVGRGRRAPAKAEAWRLEGRAEEGACRRATAGHRQGSWLAHWLRAEPAAEEDRASLHHVRATREDGDGMHRGVRPLDFERDIACGRDWHLGLVGVLGWAVKICCLVFGARPGLQPRQPPCIRPWLAESSYSAMPFSSSLMESDT
jgi:hypothetical protein